MSGFDKTSWKPYDDRELKEGEVLVPQLTDETDARLRGANMGNLRTWTKAGIDYLVLFVPVPEADETVAMKAFNAAVNEMLDERLGPNRHSRCLIPQPDGTSKPCPKKNRNNHETCAGCPHRYDYEREDRSTVSFSTLEEYEYAAGASPSAEAEALEAIYLDLLLEMLEEKDPRLAKVVELGDAGFDRPEIISMLDAGKSQSYNLYNEAKHLAEAFLTR